MSLATTIDAMRRRGARIVVLLAGNIPGIPRALKVEYLRAALSELDPMSDEVPFVVHQLAKLDRSA